MEKNETENTVKSILRQAAAKSDTRKRLSFANTNRDSVEESSENDEVVSAANLTTLAEEFPRNSGTLPEADKVAKRFHPDDSYTSANSDDEQMETEEIEMTPVCKSLRSSPAGLYYVPSSRKNRQYSDSLPIIPMKENSRHVFKTSFDGISATTAKIMILGNKCHGEKIRDNLLSLKETQSSSWSMRWNLQLDIHVDDDPSTRIYRETNYFIFLAHLDALDSLVKLSAQLAKIRKCGALPAVSGTVLCMTSAQGTFRNVITNENLAKFFSDHQLPYIHWGKPEKDHYLKILHSIYESLGYNSGLSLLNKSVLQWNTEITVLDY